MDQHHPDTGIDPRLVEIFREVFGRPELQLRPDMTADDIPEWDSIRMLTLLLAIEQRLGATLRAAEIRRIGSVGDLARLVRNRMG